MKRILFLLPLFLAACSSTPDVVSRLNPFKIDVRQGNYVTQDMVAKLRPGQTKEQVRFILGSPLLVDVFHTDRWDYVYYMKHGSNGLVEQRNLTVFFQDGLLVRVAGDVVARSTDEPVEMTPPQRVIDIEGARRFKGEES